MPNTEVCGIVLTTLFHSHYCQSVKIAIIMYSLIRSFSPLLIYFYHCKLFPSTCSSTPFDSFVTYLHLHSLATVIYQSACISEVGRNQTTHSITGWQPRKCVYRTQRAFEVMIELIFQGLVGGGSANCCPQC